MIFMNAHHLTRRARKADEKIRSSSLNHHDPLLEPMISMLSSTSSLSSASCSSYDSRLPMSRSFSNFSLPDDNPPLNERRKKNLKIKTEDKIHEKSKFSTAPKKLEISNDTTTEHPFRNLIFSPQCTPEKFKEHLSLIQRGLIYSKVCLKQPSAHYLNNKYINLPEKKRDVKTLLFDLDETLIHTCVPDEDSPQYRIRLLTEEDELTILGINVRPFCIEALHTLSKYYELFVFTASSENYANSIVDFLDPNNRYISGILSRQQCMQTKSGFFIKDLRILNNRDLKDMAIIDNMPHSFGFQIENGIPILEWFNDQKDTELKFLTKYLLEALNYDDFRVYNKEKLKLEELAVFDEFL